MDTTCIDEQRVLALPAGGPVHRLDCESGQRTELRVLAGRVWLTREGWLDDHFLGPGEAWSVIGAARLHLSPEGGLPAQLELLRS
ncbi:DUF2917 domain-containing protein [Paucibacter sp. R3-3]|uniref:DUF2917 domain-containing protein n=1 Tax=Roseateles agri TaxID=3098619 RepID=A0ABU5DFV7_9BURK|nr:DUF2917 domain-containing protein [Paucibacter sp. R3-3]MDY0744691.1 DUF2917 domain-containing protein [Paucibacter sp. R3-3]